MAEDKRTLLELLVEEFQRDRNILLLGEVNEEMAIRTMLLLRKFDRDDPDEPIYLYINSPGGSVIDGLSIIDNMALIHAPVYTVVVGMAASMGAVIFSCGEKGHRYMLENSQLMIHQPWRSMQSAMKESDMAAAAEEMTNKRRKLEKILQRN